MLLFVNPKNHVKKMRHCAYLPTNESRTLFFSNSANLKRLCVKSKAANYEENLTVPRQLMPKEGKIYAKTTASQLLCVVCALPHHLEGSLASSLPPPPRRVVSRRPRSRRATLTVSVVANIRSDDTTLKQTAF